MRRRRGALVAIGAALLLLGPLGVAAGTAVGHAEKQPLTRAQAERLIRELESAVADEHHARVEAAQGPEALRVTAGFLKDAMTSLGRASRLLHAAAPTGVEPDPLAAVDKALETDREVAHSVARARSGKLSESVAVAVVDKGLTKAQQAKLGALAALSRYEPPTTTEPSTTSGTHAYVYDVTDIGSATATSPHDFDGGATAGTYSGSASVHWTIEFTVDVLCSAGCHSFTLSRPPTCTWSFCDGGQLATSESGSISEDLTEHTAAGLTYHCSYSAVPLTVDTFHFEWSGKEIPGGHGDWRLLPFSAHIDQQGIAADNVPSPGTCSANTGSPTYYPSDADLVGLQGPACPAWGIVVAADVGLGEQDFTVGNDPFPAASPDCKTMLGAVWGSVTATREVSFHLVSSG